MKILITILAILQMLGGIVFYVAAGSAIHQILAAVSFGLGTVCLALAVIIGHLERQNELS